MSSFVAALPFTIVIKVLFFNVNPLKVPLTSGLILSSTNWLADTDDTTVPPVVSVKGDVLPPVYSTWDKI